MLSGPETSRILKGFDDEYLNDNDPGDPKNYQNHETSQAYQRKFQSQVNSLVDTIRNMGNPFVDDFPELITLDSRDCTTPCVTETMQSLEEIGKTQYMEYKRAVLIDREKSIHDPIKKNNLPVFAKPQKRSTSKQEKKITFLQKNVTIFSQMYIALQTRDGDMDDFFAHEVQSYPPSISDDGNICLPTAKSELLKCLPKPSDEPNPPNNFDCIVLDAAVLVHSLSTTGAVTFDDYADKIFIRHILSRLQHSTRVDIVWDEYLPDSLKESTREKRGSGVRRKVGFHAKLPTKWMQFLRDNDNKKELFQFLTQKVENFSFPPAKVVNVTKGFVSFLH